MSRVEDTVKKIKALRWLTAQTGTKTTRSQNALLQALSAEELAEVALRLNEERD